MRSIYTVLLTIFAVPLIFLYYLYVYQQHRRTWRHAARIEAIRKLDLQLLKEKAAQRIVDDDMVSDSDMEYANCNFYDVSDSSDESEENFDLHDAPMDEDHDFDEDNELCDNESSEDENIMVENEEINQINMQNLVVNDIQINEYVLRSLKEWGKRGVTGKKINELLRILRIVFPEFPKDYRSLLSTPRSTPVKNIGNGQLWYKGIRSNIQSKLSEEYFAANQEIVMDVNIDGMKPFPQSCSQKDFWPILGSFANQDEPFIIAVFYGNGKPNDLNAFLEEYVVEVADLQESGLEINGIIYPFRVRNYILDAPARAFIKCCVGHGGTFACEKCCVTGRRYRGREVFLDMDADLRSNKSYNIRENPQHHTGMSPLERIGTGMISQFRLDSMHLKDQGAFKRWLKFLLVTPGNFTLSDATLTAVSDALVGLAPHTPKEFNRKPRQLKRSGNRLKAQELRRIALYDGVKIFKNLTPALYQNFLLFHTATYILSSPHLLDRYVDIAEELMREFVTHSIQIFGREFVVYNIHSLIHLAKECRQHGVLDKFSAYKFENYLGVIKHCLRCPYQPLQQVANRDFETNGKLRKTDSKALGPQEIRLGKRRRSQIRGDYYSIKTCDMTLAVNEADCCFVTNQNDVVVLTNIIHTPQGQIRLIGHRFTCIANYYDFPIDSADIGIFSVSELSEQEQLFRLSDVARKCYLIPDGNIYLCIPLTHSL